LKIGILQNRETTSTNRVFQALRGCFTCDSTTCFPFSILIAQRHLDNRSKWLCSIRWQWTAT